MGNEVIPWEGIWSEGHRGYTWCFEEYFKYYGRPLGGSFVLFSFRILPFRAAACRGNFISRRMLIDGSSRFLPPWRTYPSIYG